MIIACVVSCGKWKSNQFEIIMIFRLNFFTISLYRWAVDLMKDPIDFFLVAPSSRPSISPVPTTETQPPTRGPTPKPTNSPTARIQYDPTLCLGCPTGSNLLLPSTDCLGFYYCTNGYSSRVISCPAGTLFDVGIQTCNWADAVTCQW